MQQFQKNPTISHRNNKNQLYSLTQSCFNNINDLFDFDSYNKSLSNHQQFQGKQFIEIIELLNILYQDKYQLNKCSQMRTPIRQLITYSNKYYEIVPLILSIYLKNQYQKGQNIQKLDQILKDKIQYFGDKYVRKAQGIILQEINIKIPQYKKVQKLNLFKNSSQISSINDLLKQLNKIAQKSQRYLPQFKQFIQKCCKNGQYIKSNIKIKQNQSQNIKLSKYIRVFQKIFDQLKKKKKQISQEFQQRIKNKYSISQHIKIYIEIFLQKVSEQINRLKQSSNPIKCNVSDFLRGNCYFYNIQDFQNAINLIFQQAQKRQYGILQLSQRKTRGTCEIVFKIIIHDMICQIQLIKVPNDVKLDITARQFIHTLYQIRRSPLGCVLGVYLLISKFERIHLFDKSLQIQKYCGSKYLNRPIQEPLQYFISKLQKKLETHNQNQKQEKNLASKQIIEQQQIVKNQ